MLPAAGGIDQRLRIRAMNHLPRKDLVRSAHRPEKPEDGALGRRLLHEPKFGIREAAKMMKLGQTGLRRLIKNGEIPVIRIGSKLILLETDMERFLTGHHVLIRPVPLRKTAAQSLPESIAASELLKDL